MRLLTVAALLALLPVASAGYEPCATENTLVDTPGWDVVLSMDASPCVGVESRGVGPSLGGGCATVLWGVDAGVLVVGGRDTCHAMAKADVDACDGPILWTPYCAMYGNEYHVCGKPVFELCIWGP